MARQQDNQQTLGKILLQAGFIVIGAMCLYSCGGGSAGDGGGTLDPLVEDFGIAYVRQPLGEMDTADIREPTAFNEGSDLIFRDLASPVARERNITFGVTGGLGDVKDVEASHDGSTLLFALRMPDIEGAAPEDQPTWNIWEYRIASGTLSRVIGSDTTAEAGQDVTPHYLPDGRIIFSSTRQRTSGATLLDEGKPQFAALDERRNEPAFVLHVMNADGSNIHQVSFNQSHDLDPVVLRSGEVLFSRWDNMGSRNGIHLYRMYPDGTNLRLRYGANSHATGTAAATSVEFIQPRELPDGRIAVLMKPAFGTFGGGDIIAIDVDNYIENTQPTLANTGILTGPAQESLAVNNVNTDLQASAGGRFNAFYPLWDGTDRALISWSQCRLIVDSRIVPCTDTLLNDPNIEEAPPLYGVYIYDMTQKTQIPVFTPSEGVLYRDVVAAQPVSLPPIWFDESGAAKGTFSFDPALIGDNAGILNIRSVYDFDGAFNPLGATATGIVALADPAQTLADQRPARFLRIVKAVGIPDRDLVDLRGTDFGVSTQQLMREIIGYAPIEPDGSVRIKVPANIPFAISVLDKDGKRITARHQNWLQLRPGEIITCQGCHTANTGVSHGRPDAFAPLYAGAPADGYIFDNTETFFANSGETMAEARTRLDATALDLSVDIHFQDVWTNEDAAQANRPKDASFDYVYDDLYPDTDPDKALKTPVSEICQTKWDTLCRIVINYERHIHPIWSVDRGAAATCTACHTNSVAGVAVVPEGQLDLSDGLADPPNEEHFKSYRELLRGDNAQVLNGAVLVDEQATDPITGDPLFELDANGDPDPTQPIFVRAPGPSMSTGGALASSRFFSRFADPADATHFSTLTTVEIKLLAEWLDIGAQYYNNPFDVPP